MSDNEKDIYREVADVVAEELLKTIKEREGIEIGGAALAERSDASEAGRFAPANNTKERGERAVVTSTGFNSPGIVAALTSTIFECGGDIRDISQTIVSDFFTMIMIVDISRLSEKGITFKEFKRKLTEKAKEVGVEVVVIHEDILKSMHRI